MANQVDLKEPKQQEELKARYELDNIDMMMLKHLSKFPATTATELAGIVGLQRPAVSKRLAKPAFKRALDEVMADTKEVMKRNALAAARRLGKLINSKDDNTALNAIKIALTPFVQKMFADESVSVVPMIKTYETTVAVDGSLIQKMIEAEIERDAKKTDDVIEAVVSKEG
jgi:hypothetical protein